MIYCVVPTALEGELFEQAHRRTTATTTNVEVIVERRRFDRRARHGHRAEPAMLERRIIRDRRRARVAGDTLPLAHA